MAAFTALDARWFFGRRHVTAQLLERVDQGQSRSGALIVVAPSGAGKSSLLHAGLIHRLAQGALPGSQHWPVIAMTPTAKPLAALANGLKKILGLDPSRFSGESALPVDQGIGLVLDAVGTRSPTVERARLVIVVDQLEELFTLCEDEAERCRFLDVLTALAEQRSDDGRTRVQVLYGLRADFYRRCADYPALWEVLGTDQFLVEPMTTAELREAIRFPAESAGMTVEPGLVDLLLSDLREAGSGGGSDRYRVGRLPLLAYALRATWRERSGHLLTVEGYQSTGGIRRAVNDAAEGIFTPLDPAEKRAARAVFLRLVRIGSGSEDSRRRVPRADLLALGSDPATVDSVLRRYTEGRLLIQEQDTVLITHEAILDAWPRLRQWIDGDLADNLIRQELEDSAAAWERGGRENEALLRGNNLDAAVLAGAPPHVEDLSAAAVTFLAASVGHRRRTTMVRRTAVALICCLTLITSFAAVVANQERTAAVDRGNAALANQVVAQAAAVQNTQPGLARQLLAAARNIDQTPEVTAGLAASSSIPQEIQVPAYAMAYNAKGTLLALADTGSAAEQRTNGTVLPAVDAQLMLYDTATLKRVYVRDLGAFQVRDLAFSPAGDILAVPVGANVELWDTSQPRAPKELGSLKASAEVVESVTFSTGGHTLATAGDNGDVEIWNLTGPRLPPSPAATFAADQNPLEISVAAQPRGDLLGVAVNDSGHSVLKLWNIAQPSKPRWVQVTIPPFDAFAFAPDGEHIATVAGSSAELWPLTQSGGIGTPIALPTRSSTARLSGIAYGADGRIATLSDDATVTVWDALDPTAPTLAASLPISENDVGQFDPALAFSAAGTRLTLLSQASTSTSLTDAGVGSSTIRIWGVADPREPGASISIRSVDNAVGGAVTSPDNQLLVTLGEKTVHLWDVSNPADAQLLGGVPVDSPAAAAISGNGDLLAVAVTGGALVYNITDPRNPSPQYAYSLPDNGNSCGGISQGCAIQAASVAFCDGGRRLAVGDTTGYIDIFDLSDPGAQQPVAVEATHGAVMSLVAIPPTTGKALASASLNTMLDLWDVSAPDPANISEVAHETSGTGQIRSMAVSPDGGTLAVANQDETVQLWQTDAGHTLTAGQMITDTGEVDSVAYAPGGARLATVDGDESVRVYAITGGSAVLQTLLQLGTDGGEQVLFLHDDSTLATTELDGAVDEWDVDPATAAQYLCTGFGQPITPRQWSQDVPGQPYRPPC